MDNNNTHIIALTGAARAGKDTVARIMQQELVTAQNPQWQDMVIALESFAAPIKSMVAMMLDFFGIGSIMNPQSLSPYIDGDQKETHLEVVGASPRRLMQTLGTDWGRALINENLWLNSMEIRCNQYGEAVKHGHRGAVVIITDCRFDNEAELVRRMGGKVVRITTDRQPEQAVENHASENGVSEELVDFTFENDVSFDELPSAVVSLLDKVFDTRINGVGLILPPPKEIALR